MFTLSPVSFGDLTANKQSFGSGGISTARVNRRENWIKNPFEPKQLHGKIHFLDI